MHTIPLTVLDNFLDEPDKMRSLALSLPYHKNPEGRWPGVRSEPLRIINKDISDRLVGKVLSLFFLKDPGWYVQAHFQKVGNHYGKGWVHTDAPYMMTGIIYLDPNPAPNSGTAILEKKYLDSTCKNLAAKENFYKGLITEQEAEPARNENNCNFSKSIVIESKYNRLLCFDSHLLHSAGEFCGHNDSERLTLVFFVSHIGTAATPIFRSKQIIL